MDFGGVFGAAGQIAGAFIASDAAKKATAIQNQAMQDVRTRLEGELSPSTLQQIATQGDTQRAQQQQQLFSQMFPDLASASSAAQKSLQMQAGGYGAQSQASQVGNAAVADALKNAGATQQGQNQLIDAALEQLKAGATLPPDVEAQLVQSGLESSGMVTQHASGQGIGGQQIRTLLGTAGIQLQQQRQVQAASLLTQAQNLETQRQSVLQDLFPKLSSVQLQQTQGAAGIFNTAQSAVPQAGLSGTQLANTWLQRIGALNQAQEQQAGINASGQLAQGQIWGNAIGSAVGGLGSMGIGGMGGGGGQKVNNGPALFSSLQLGNSGQSADFGGEL
jgi:hypothetical protein